MSWHHNWMLLWDYEIWSECICHMNRCGQRCFHSTCHSTLCSCHCSIKRWSLFLSPSLILAMRSWATRIRKRKSTGLVVSACFLLEPTLCCEEAWERIPWRRNNIAGPQCDRWTHTEYFSPAICSVPSEAPHIPAGLHLICWLTKPGAWFVSLTSGMSCSGEYQNSPIIYQPFPWCCRDNSE